MTAISLGQVARPSRLGTMAISAAIQVGRSSRDSSKYLVGPVQSREKFEADNVTSPSQQLAGGFVDFLLGRRAHHPR